MEQLWAVGSSPCQAPSMSSMLAVPIHGAEDEVLELPKDQLPDDPNEIMQILANELAPLLENCSTVTCSLLLSTLFFL